MKKVVRRGRPVGSKNKPKAKPAPKQESIILDRTINALEQATDQITDLHAQVEFYKKQVNHLLALCNILARGA